MRKDMTIGKIARAAGVPTSTIRYYERRHLLPEPKRTYSGYRYYPIETLNHIRFIKSAKSMGFTLNEIRAIKRFYADPGPRAREAVGMLIKQKVGDLSKTLAETQKSLTAVEKMADAVERGRLTDFCRRMHDR